MFLFAPSEAIIQISFSPCLSLSFLVHQCRLWPVPFRARFLRARPFLNPGRQGRAGGEGGGRGVAQGRRRAYQGSIPRPRRVVFRVFEFCVFIFGFMARLSSSGCADIALFLCGYQAIIKDLGKELTIKLTVGLTETIATGELANFRVFLFILPVFSFLVLSF